MRILVTVKQFGGKRPLVEKEFVLSGVSTVRDLIAELVRQETAAYNARPDDSVPLVVPLRREDIEAGAVSGKIGFGVRHGKRQDPDEAIAAAASAYADGLFKIFIGESEAGGLEDALALHDGDKLTFIKLMMLSGF